MKSIRCTRCRAEFSEAEAVGRGGCPACGDTGVPMSIAQDVTLRINWHELRILTIWADNYAREHCQPDGQAALAAIIRALEAQRPDGSFAPLTLLGEIQEVVDAGVASSATITDRTGTVTIKPKVGKA